MRELLARRRGRRQRERELRARAAEAESELRDTRTDRDTLREVLAALADGGIPPRLIDAARSAPADGRVVRTTIDGCEIIAVIGDEGGSPAEWVAAITRDLRRRRAS